VDREKDMRMQMEPEARGWIGPRDDLSCLVWLGGDGRRCLEVVKYSASIFNCRDEDMRMDHGARESMGRIWRGFLGFNFWVPTSEHHLLVLTSSFVGLLQSSLLTQTPDPKFNAGDTMVVSNCLAGLDVYFEVVWPIHLAATSD
jgi:hypothetical protein